MDPQPWTASNKLLYDAKTSRHMRIRLNESENEAGCSWERVGKRNCSECVVSFLQPVVLVVIGCRK